MWYSSVKKGTLWDKIVHGKLLKPVKFFLFLPPGICAFWLEQKASCWNWERVLALILSDTIQVVISMSIGEHNGGSQLVWAATNLKQHSVERSLNISTQSKANDWNGVSGRNFFRYSFSFQKAFKYITRSDDGANWC